MTTETAVENEPAVGVTNGEQNGSFQANGVMEINSGDKGVNDSHHSSPHKSSHHKSSHHKSSHHKSSHHKSSHKSSHKDGHRDKEKSSSSVKDKDSKGSSSKSKDGSSSKHKSSHKSSHHKSEHRDKSSSSHKSKSRDHHSSKHKSHSDKRHKEKKEMEIHQTTVVSETILVKQEYTNEGHASDHLMDVDKIPMENNVQEDASEDDVPLSSKLSDSLIKTEDNIGGDAFNNSHNNKKSESDDDDDDDDVPLSSRLNNFKKSSSDDEPDRGGVDENYDDDEEDDVPLRERMNKKKRKGDESGNDYKPISTTPKKSTKNVKKRKVDYGDYSSEEEVPKKSKKTAKSKPSGTVSKSVKKEKKEEPPNDKWKWWEEDRKDDGTKWYFLEHKGPVFAPDYEVLPPDVKFYYDGREMKLSKNCEEVATFYGKMIDHDYTSMAMFNNNFFKDWRSVMTREEKETITDLKKCDFREIDTHFKKLSEERKNSTKEEKKKRKEENEALIAEYGFSKIDGHVEKIGNFRIEPPGLFRGRGNHPKMGKLKRRVVAEDIIINCSKDSVIPKPPAGHKWKEVRHDNTVTWLASWCENIQGSTKYIMLNAASKLKGQKDWQKYETARRLHNFVDKIRANYSEDFKSKEMRIRQRAVALYFIDKLALRAGNEKDEGESADTVGCCSLRVEHIKLLEESNGKKNVVVFDFPGKDSIRYYNEVAVESRVFKNLRLFKENKNDGDDLFDRLNTTIMNKHLQCLMEGLTAKVFRTYNASKTLQEQLNLLTDSEDSIAAKILSYNRANRAVAVLCNHQRAAPKNFDKQMENIQNKIDAKRDLVKEAKKEVKLAKADYKAVNSAKNKELVEKKKKTLGRLEEQLVKLEVQQTDKDENKEIALGTSKLNYLDPRISISWCKKFDVPIEKVYNKTQRDKFAWAAEMVGDDFQF